MLPKKQWHVITALDRPSNRTQEIVRKFFHDNLLAHKWQAAWPIHKDIGGDLHFLVVNCEQSEANVLRDQFLYLLSK